MILAPGSLGRRPSVTVVIPCYNYGHFLAAAVRSVLDQEGVEASVIIVDDASPDGSAAVAQAIAAADPRVRVLEHPVNRGHIATYNDGLALVTTDYVSLVSADDLVALGALARATALMERHPRVGMVYGVAVDFEDGTEPDLGTARLPETWSVWHGPAWTRRHARHGVNPILSPEVVLRTAALRDVGEYNSSLPHSGDLEYWLRVAARWDIGRVNCRAQAHYRVHSANMHSTRFGDLTVDLRQRLDAFSVLADPETVRLLPDGDRQFAIARAALARRARHEAWRRLNRGGRARDVGALLDFAVEADGLAAGGTIQRLRRRLALAEAGSSPRRVDRWTEYALTQADRVRFRTLRATAKL